MEKTIPPHILAAFPTYDGWRANGEAIFNMARSPFQVSFLEVKSSLLAKTFNTAIGYAMVERDRINLTHLLIMHADIKPVQPDWLSILLREALDHQAEVMSVISPIKDDRGLTSTALDTDRWEPKRFTMHEVMAMPETWTQPKLLVNTGMLLIALQNNWYHKICFTINDEINVVDNVVRINVEPEDWHFSRQLHKLGVTPWATRKVHIKHEGSMNYTNYEEWGKVKHDKEPA